MYLHFGKYRNQTIQDIYKKDRRYLEWLIKQTWFKIKFKDMRTQIIHLLSEKIHTEENDRFIIYTDGACSHNGSKNAKAGIGIHYSDNNKIRLNDISLPLDIINPTNNKAELKAIEKSLQDCLSNKIDKITIYTDSQYSINCITKWYPGWIKKNDFENKKNLDILDNIYHIIQKLDVNFIHIRSHTNLTDKHSIGNSMADRLATQCLKC